MVDGFFHDAHEVYMIEGDKETWIATFATKGYAEGYILWSAQHAALHGVYPEADERMEVRPV